MGLSLSSVNYKIVGQGIVGVIVLGTVGYLGFNFLDKVWKSYKEARDQRLHCVVNLIDFSPKGHEEALKNAIARYQKEKSFQWLYPIEKPTLEEDFNTYQKEFEDGCCHGAISNLFYGMLRQGLSIEQSAQALNIEEIYFRQLTQKFQICIKFREKEEQKRIESIKETRNKRRLQNFVYFLAGYLDVSMSAMEKGIQEFKGYKREITNLKEKIREYQEEKVHLQEIDPILTSVVKSQKFSPFITSLEYQSMIEGILGPISRSVQVRGTINIPKHVIGFEYSIEGYYLFDTFSMATGGLLKYRNKESFFKKMRDLVLKTLPTIQKLTQKEIQVSFHLFSQ